MAAVSIEDYLAMVRGVRNAPHRQVWSTYDAEADVLYINVERPSVADDSELTDDDVIVHCRGYEVVGLTILPPASARRD